MTLVPLDDMELTPAEKAYMESGGENSEAFLKEAGVETTVADPAAKTEPVVEQKTEPAAKTEPVVDQKTAATTDEPLADDTAADLAATDPQRPPPSRVSYHKFKRAEERAKTAEQQLTEERQKYARVDERVKLLTEAFSVPAADPAKKDPRPDPDTDLVGFIKWSERRSERLESELKAARGEIGKTQETLKTRDSADALQDNYQRDVVRFAQATPDFVQAYNHMIAARASMLEGQGYSHDEIRATLFTEERGLVQRAVAVGKSPAELIYGMAKSFGYQPPGKAAGGTKSGEGGSAAPAAGETASVASTGKSDGKPTAAEILKSVQSGQEAGKTLSGTGGAASDLSVDALANMSEAEFAALLHSSPRKVESLLGRAN